MPLRECMENHTERELRVWLEWLNMQMEEPDRSDWYLMQIACEVRRVLSNKPASIKVQDFKLGFGQQPRRRPQTPEQAAVESKARWFGLLGLPLSGE